jgi:uncharacterized oxidoreductase
VLLRTVNAYHKTKENIMNLSGNTILITGGTSGIGLGFAREFQKLGNKVIICGRREERLKEISEKHPGIIALPCDVSIESERVKLVHNVISDYPDINILINNAGIQMNYDIQHDKDCIKLYQETDTNFIAPIHLSALFIPFLKTKPNPSVINITSGLAFVPLAFMPVYCATKAGLHSFTLSLRHQLKNTSIKVFEIAPPAVDTELGQDNRTGAVQSHGGISVNEFIKETMIALENDEFEAAIGAAKNLKEKGVQVFNYLNK